jgi:4-aminobutyrate aminotransferase-like enzyme
MAVLDVLEGEGLMANAEQVGMYLRERLRDLMTRYPAIGDVRGAGLYNAVELVDDPVTRHPASSLASAVINGLRQRQVLIGAAGPHGHILKLRPPLCFSREHVDTLVRAIAETLASLGRG